MAIPQAAPRPELPQLVAVLLPSTGLSASGATPACGEPVLTPKSQSGATAGSVPGTSLPAHHAPGLRSQRPTAAQLGDYRNGFLA